MAVLAIYPHGSKLHLAVTVGQFSETTTFPLNLGVHSLVGQIQNWFEILQIASSDLNFIVTSGHLPPNFPSGLYALSPGFLDPGLANRGPQLGQLLGDNWRIPTYIVDPSSLLECDPLALVTGTPEINRECRCDSFVFKYLVSLEEEKRSLSRGNGKFIVAHLDEEIQIGAISQGQMVDGGRSIDEGPFAWQQAGALPFDGLLDLCLEMQEREATLRKIKEASGLQGYLGLERFEQLFEVDGEDAKVILQALVHQVSKEIGAYAAVLKGQAQGVILGGELTKHQFFLTTLTTNIKFLGNISIYPGNQGLPALSNGAQRIQAQERILKLNGEESDAYGVC